jgi:YVTN family beta-propeller protein
MKKLYLFLAFLSVVIIAAIFFLPRAHKWARAHVNYMTATEDHPLLCTNCHLYRTKSGLIHNLVNAKYYSPFDMAVSDDGKNLFVVAEEGNSILIVDTEKGKVTGKIKVGEHPYGIVLNKEGSRAYVSNQWGADVYVIDLKSKKVIDTLMTGDGPAGVALSADGQILYAVNSYTSNLSVIDLNTHEEIKRLDLGNNPTGIQSTPDGQYLYVTSRRTLSKPYDDTVRCEITVIDDKTRKISTRRDIESAYLMENIAFTPQGDLAIFPLIRPKNNVTTVQVDRGWMMTNGFGIMELKPEGRTIQLLSDEPNAYFADPFDIAVTPDGKRAFISSSGTDYISVIDVDSVRKILEKTPTETLKAYANYLGASSSFVVKRIKTGANPKGIKLSADGKKLYVAEHLDDRIGVINVSTLENEKSISLGGPKRITVPRHGRQLLNNAGATFQTQYSCYTCHPDTHEDGLVYNMASKDMGRNVTNTQSLRDIMETAPYKWNGKNATAYRQDGMRFSTVLTRTEAFAYKDLDALVAYINTGIKYPPNLQFNPHGDLTEMQELGKAIFERTHTSSGVEIPVQSRCVTCHPAPYYTNRQMFNVGTLASSDDSILFDTPHLNNIYASSPYLHDGRAKTLEEIWTIYGKTEEHGIVNDLTKMELNYLVEYLKSLRAPEYEKADMERRKASKP